MSETTAKAKPRHYVIVVHGMGVQKESETAFEVIHRFAEVRNGQNSNKPTYRNLLPPTLSSQSVLAGKGHGWAEFRGIPVDPADHTGPFDGLPATTTAGRNFRFVDLRWSQILAEDEEAYACKVKQWTEALREKFKSVLPAPLQVKWAGLVLEQIQHSALTVQVAVTYFKPDWAKLIFDEILGNVHLYGDYTRTRGKAVRHFHLVLDEIFVRDFLDWHRRTPDTPYEQPRFTVIAHSLGTIMSFDALMYAFAKRPIRDGSQPHDCPSLPFPAYTEQAPDEDTLWNSLARKLKAADLDTRFKDLTGATIAPHAPEVPTLFWRDCVKEFITLGSPIDKFHTLWYQNYLHMGFQKLPHIPLEWSANWLECSDNWIDEAKAKIKHVNLSDEQDPVGHHLDIAQSTVNYAKVFATHTPVACRDIIFRRYPVPGLAHIEYWRDHPLFRGIIWHVMDLPPIGMQPDEKYFVADAFRNLPGVYRKILVWAYFRIPLITAMTTGILIMYGLGGLTYFGFSIGSVIALLAACLLWIQPYSTQAYRAETDFEVPTHLRHHIAKWWRPFKQRWKPRQGLFANLVAGAAEWRRILILQSEGQAFSLQQAQQLGTRMAFQTQGGFLKNVWWRYVMGLLWVVPAAFYLHVHPPTWSSQDHVPQLAAEAIGILSLCYLATMGFVTWAFWRAKRLTS